MTGLRYTRLVDPKRRLERSGCALLFVEPLCLTNVSFAEFLRDRDTLMHTIGGIVDLCNIVHAPRYEMKAIWRPG